MAEVPKNLIPQLPFTNYVFYQMGKIKDQIAAKIMIGIARYYATHGLYLEQWDLKDVSKPELTRKLPTDCSFLNGLEGSEEYEGRCYVDVVLCLDLEEQQETIVKANSRKDAVKELEKNPSINFFLIKGILTPAHSLFSEEVVIKNKKLQHLLIVKAVMFRAALPIVSANILIDESLVTLVCEQCYMDLDDALSWIVACLGCPELVIGLEDMTINPYSNYISRVKNYDEGLYGDFKITILDGTLKRGGYRYEPTCIGVGADFASYEIFVPSNE